MHPAPLPDVEHVRRVVVSDSVRSWHWILDKDVVYVSPTLIQDAAFLWPTAAFVTPGGTARGHQ